MNRGLRFFLAVLAATLLAAGAAHAPEALARVDAFDVTDVRLEGQHFLTHEEALEAADVPSGASVWDDMDPVEERLRGHPLVRDARVRRRFPGTLVLEVREREPVALVPTPGLVPLDASGRTLPVDPAVHRLDLPLVDPYRDPARPESRLTPAQLGAVAGELGRLARVEPQLTARISRVVWLGDAIRAHLDDPSVEILFRPRVGARRIREGLTALADASERWPDARPRAVDLRFDEQVVVRYGN